MTVPPPVLRAFGLSAPVERLTGGKGGTWRCGPAVLKPAEGEPETVWRASVLATLPPSPSFRVAQHLLSDQGAVVVDGWEATAWLPGEADPRRVDDILHAGEAFHAALRDVPPPSFLQTRTDPWSWGDRLAFGDPVPPGSTAPSPLLEPLLAARRDITAPPQMVHGDLIGNVLFADTRPPAIIDWPAYHRPATWASAVVVTDALVWHAADPSLIRSGERHGGPDWPQMLIRALIYRIATWAAARWAQPPDDAYRPTVARVLSYAGQ